MPDTLPEFSEAKRYDYPLTDRSIVIDVGGYEGTFARHISDKYKCRVDVYEPVKRFHSNCVRALGKYPLVRVYNFGVSDKREKQAMHIQNDSTGAFAGSAEVEECEMLAIGHVVQVAGGFRHIDLLKLNCEGGEYAILEALLISKDPFGPAIKRFRNLQVQFHTCVPDYQARYDKIAQDLGHTHELTWRTPFVWENWDLKPETP